MTKAKSTTGCFPFGIRIRLSPSPKQETKGSEFVNRVRPTSVDAPRVRRTSSGGGWLSKIRSWFVGLSCGFCRAKAGQAISQVASPRDEAQKLKLKMSAAKSFPPITPPTGEVEQETSSSSPPHEEVPELEVGQEVEVLRPPRDEAQKLKLKMSAAKSFPPITPPIGEVEKDAAETLRAPAGKSVPSAPHKNTVEQETSSPSRPPGDVDELKAAQTTFRTPAPAAEAEEPKVEHTMLVPSTARDDDANLIASQRKKIELRLDEPISRSASLPNDAQRSPKRPVDVSDVTKAFSIFELAAAATSSDRRTALVEKFETLLQNAVVTGTLKLPLEGVPGKALSLLDAFMKTRTISDIFGPYGAAAGAIRALQSDLRTSFDQLLLAGTLEEVTTGHLLLLYVARALGATAENLRFDAKLTDWRVTGNLVEALQSWRHEGIRLSGPLAKLQGLMLELKVNSDVRGNLDTLLELTSAGATLTRLSGDIDLGKEREPSMVLTYLNSLNATKTTYRNLTLTVPFDSAAKDSMQLSKLRSTTECEVRIAEGVDLNASNLALLRALADDGCKLQVKYSCSLSDEAELRRLLDSVPPGNSRASGIDTKQIRSAVNEQLKKIAMPMPEKKSGR